MVELSKAWYFIVLVSCFYSVICSFAVCNEEANDLLTNKKKTHKSATQFRFLEGHSKVLPDPSLFFSSDLLSAPLPTNSFFQNFVIPNGTETEYIHPYQVKSSLSFLSVCYPSLFANSSWTFQVFSPDLNISALTNTGSKSTHEVSSFSDLGVTLDFPSSNLRFFLVRGSPFITFEVTSNAGLLISTIHAIRQFSCSSSLTKCTIKLSNRQTWLLYASSPIHFRHEKSRVTCRGFSGIIRLVVLPDSSEEYESIFDSYSSCYPVSGDAVITKPFSIEYKWQKAGQGDLLMLAHPLHLQLLSKEDDSITILEDFKFESIDGELVGVVGDSWLLSTDPIPVTWHSARGLKAKSHPEIIRALRQDVEALNPRNLSTNSSYFYGKLIARAARFVLIAEEASYPEVIPSVVRFLKNTIEPWLDGTFAGNGFLYEKKWGGLVTVGGLLDPQGDFGFGIYNDHHFHLGYFLYAISVLNKVDPVWGQKYRPQTYALAEDFLNLDKTNNRYYPRLRNFDLWKLHSWAAGLYEFPNGRNQESTSEAVNAYYSAALLGLAYGDTHLFNLGSTLLAMEIQSAQTWWQVRKNSNLYSKKFAEDNRIVGILWSNTRDSKLWFAPAEWRECKLGIQVLPLLPITEELFSDVGYAKELVEWTLPALERPDVGEGWKNFVYALEGLYDKEKALADIRNLKGYDDGNSLSNLLWWAHSQNEMTKFSIEV